MNLPNCCSCLSHFVYFLRLFLFYSIILLPHLFIFPSLNILIEITHFWPTKMTPDLFSDFLFSFQFPPQNPGPFPIDHFVLPHLLLKITWTQVRSHWSSHKISHRYSRRLRLIWTSLKLKYSEKKKKSSFIYFCVLIFPTPFSFAKRVCLSFSFFFFFIQASLVLFEQSKNFQREERSHVIERLFFSTTENTVNPLM